MMLYHLSKTRKAANSALNYSPVSLLHNRLPSPSKENRRRSPNRLPPLPLRHPILHLLEQCSTARQLKQIQAHMVLSGVISDGFAASRLVAFCAAAPDADTLAYCADLLSGIDNPNVFSWNVAIRGYSGNLCPKESIFHYKRMLGSDARPNNFTHPFVFKACAGILDEILGYGVFGHVLHMGLVSCLHVCNAAIHMFAVFGRLEDARKLFDTSPVRDLVTWNTMVTAYAQSALPLKALDLFEEMEEAEGSVSPDEVTMLGLVSCCTQLQDLNLGRKFHRYVEENRLEFTVPLTNALMDMYVKCASLEPARILFDGMTRKSVVSWTTMIVGYSKFGLMDAARKVFDDMPERDVVPWNALITGYAQCKRAKDALALFNEMQSSDVKPDEVTMVSVLSACSQLGALETGMWVHLYIDKHKLHVNTSVGTALVDMYAKCGNIAKSLNVFKATPEKNSLTWTAVICGLASHGHAEEAIRYFLRMTDEGFAPDDVTFVAALSACCHAGLVGQGRMFFAQMQSKYKLSPKLKHYSCMVDLLGRAGLVLEAEDLVKSMPMEPDEVVWGALFFASRVHGNVSVGRRAASKLLELNPNDSGIYVLLANMYAEAKMINEAAKVRLLMKDQGVMKTPGCSSIEVDGVVCEFIVRDRSHPEWERINACLMDLAAPMEHQGSMPCFFAIDSG